MTLTPAPKPEPRVRRPKGLKRTGSPKRRTKLKPFNRERKARRFEVQYGGKAYREHICGMPCQICGVSGWAVPAHSTTGGMGMKAHASTLVPLCGDRAGVIGCHTMLDVFPHRLPEGTEMRLRALGKQLWQAYQERRVER